MLEADPSPLDPRAPWKRPGRYALHVAGLACVAIAQPLFDLISRHEELLVAHQLRPTEIAVFAGLLAWAVPAAVALPVVVADLLGRRLGAAVYTVAILGLATLIALQALKGLPAPGAVLVAAAVVGGGLVALLLRRRPFFGSFLSAVAGGIVIFPALFLLRPPVSELLFAAPVVAAAPVDSHVPIVLVVFDELPLASLLAPGRGIDAERFPAFADLAASSIWFRNTTTAATHTSLAIPGILTGRYPGRLRAVAGAYPENLFTWLGSSYRMNVIESSSRLCPPEICADLLPTGTTGRLRAILSDLAAVYPHVALPPSLTSWAPDVTLTWRDFHRRTATPADDSTRRGDAGPLFERFIASLVPSPEPTLSYLHVNLPHVPWKYLPSGREYGPVTSSVSPQGLIGGKNWSDDDWAVQQAYQRHLLQVVYTDRLLGKMLAQLRSTDLLERSLLVVVADHGASFQPGQPRRGVNDRNLAEIALVPLFVKLPGRQVGRIDDRPAETIDILPTLAQALGSELPWAVAGRSLLSPDGKPPRRKMVHRLGKSLSKQRLKGPWLALLDAAIERKTSLFPDGLYAIGPFRELLDSSPEDRPLAPLSPLEIQLAEPWAFEDVHPQDVYLPAHVVGEIGPSAAAPPYHLAVALNGEIRAVTRSFSAPHGEIFSAMVPETAFVPGFNQLDLYEVRAGAGGPTLAPIALEPHLRYRLVRSPNGEVVELRVSDGRRLPVADSAVQGEVSAKSTHFEGWAADVVGSRPAERVLLFYDDELLARLAPLRYSREVAERYGKAELAHVGFQLVIPYGRIGTPDRSRITFLAVLDDRASTLDWTDGIRRERR